MASSGGSSSNATNGNSDSSSTSPCFRFAENGTDNSSDVPQWKRELIQRRRQQSKVSAAASGLLRSSTAAAVSTSTTATLVAGARGGAIAAVAAAATTAAATAAAVTDSNRSVSLGTTPSTPGDDAVAAIAVALTTPAINNSNGSCVGLTSKSTSSTTNTNINTTTSTTTNNDMRLEAADAAPIPGDCTEELVGNGRASRARSRPTPKDVLDIVELAKMRTNERQKEDCESDSSEELQYGPGIVHKLRSKYLNMTLREMNKNRTSVHSFRRAASLEDLLDHNDEAAEKTRRYAKKNVTGAAAKVERYRNAARGNESMKRARSVETLMRYNSAVEECSQNHTNRVASNIFKQESDNIILVDRTSVRIESRLLDKDRLKPINKPKKIKPVLAETERPPPDLVKTTMRIFEGSSIKKLKPKGDVALKVATFKTINDTFKAQNQKKIIPKPPLQPKPFVNGNSKLSTAPRKVVVNRKSTAELIEKPNNQEPYRNDGVITDPIVQSVSSVVSKFQQIEKSYSPSSSPEPSFNKIKFSPVPSPEPSANKLKVSSLDIKSPMTTPVPSPRTSPPKLQSPLSPKSEAVKQPPSSSPFVEKPIMNSTPLSNKFEQSALTLPSEIPKVDFEQDKDDVSMDQVKDIPEVNNQNTDVTNDNSKLSDTISSSGSSTMLVENFDDSFESVDNPRTVSKSALDNISKAGMTVQFRFNDHPSIKSYLPRSVSNPEQIRDRTDENEIGMTNLTEVKSKSYSFEMESILDTSEVVPLSEEFFNNLQERFQTDAIEENFHKEDHIPVVENKPIGAISSLSLIKSTTTTSYPQGNETKTIRSQKCDSNSPPQKQIGIIRPLVSTKTQLPQQNLSNREIEKNLINKVKSIEPPTKVVVSLKNTDEIPVKKNNSSGGLWDSKPWNQQNNTMVFNFSNRKDVPDYIENDGLIIKRKRDKPRAGNSSVIVSNIDSVQLTDDSDTETSDEPPSPCNVAFCNDNVLINGRSNLSRTPRNHKHRIQFDDTATCIFEYPSEASMFEVDGGTSGTSSDDGETSASGDALPATGAAGAGAGGGGGGGMSASATAAAARSTTGTLPSLLGRGGLASYTPSKVDLASEGFELGVTRATVSILASPQSMPTSPQQPQQPQPSVNEVDYLKASQDTGTWGQETAADMLY